MVYFFKKRYYLRTEYYNFEKSIFVPLLGFLI